METSNQIRRLLRSRWNLVALVLVGVVGLGTFWHLSVGRSQRLLRAITERKGVVRAEYTIDTGIPGMRYQFGPLRQIYLLGPETDDNMVALLEDAPGVRHLTLTNTRVTDAGLARLAGIRDLNTLSVGNIDFVKRRGLGAARLETPQLAGGKGLGALKDLAKLEVVALSGRATSDEDLEGLAQLKQLHKLFLENTRVSDEGLARLKKALPDCVVTRQ